MSNKKYVDINTHEFTLESLAELYNMTNINKYNIQKIRRGYFWQVIKVNAVILVGYYMYAGLNYRLKKLEKKAAKEEITVTE